MDFLNLLLKSKREHISIEDVCEYVYNQYKHIHILNFPYLLFESTFKRVDSTTVITSNVEIYHLQDIDIVYKHNIDKEHVSQSVSFMGACISRHLGINTPLEIYLTRRIKNWGPYDYATRKEIIEYIPNFEAFRIRNENKVIFCLSAMVTNFYI